MMNVFSTSFGHIPDNFSGINIVVGIVTLIVLIGLLILIIWFINLIVKYVMNKKEKYSR